MQLQLPRDLRFHKETKRPADLRTAAQIDRDRILYSPHLARLAEVTQVRSIGGEFLVHNRLTHSLKVAQVARRIAEFLKAEQREFAKKLALDEDVAEAAGLAHDLGHPPFGHIAEEKLNELVRGSGSSNAEGFEGNAQRFRIVTALSVSDAAPLDQDIVPALDLTSATLNAILKYPWLYKEHPTKRDKWGSYRTEKDIFDWAREGLPPLIRTVEAEIMDWADDITYAIHDMVDFYCAGLIPLHLLASRNGGDLTRREWKEFFDAVCARPENSAIKRNRATFEGHLRAPLELAGLDGPYRGSQEQNSTVWQFSSELISKLVAAIRLVDPVTSKDHRCVEIDRSASEQATILKQLTWHYVILRSDLAIAQHGQQSIIEDLFGIFENAIQTGKAELFPVGFAELIEHDCKISPRRWAADYISGLTERQIFELHRNLRGRA